MLANIKIPEPIEQEENAVRFALGFYSGIPPIWKMVEHTEPTQVENC